MYASNPAQPQALLEHRAAAAIAPLTLNLCADGGAAAHLEIKQLPSTQQELRHSSLPEETILGLLAKASAPLRIRAIRDHAGLRHDTVSAAVSALVAQGKIRHTDLGFSLPT